MAFFIEADIEGWGGKSFLRGRMGGRIKVVFVVHFMFDLLVHGVGWEVCTFGLAGRGRFFYGRMKIL